MSPSSKIPPPADTPPVDTKEGLKDGPKEEAKEEKEEVPKEEGEKKEEEKTVSDPFFVCFSLSTFLFCT